MKILSVLKSADGRTQKGSGGAQTVLAQQIAWMRERVDLDLTILTDGALHTSIEALAKEVIRVPMDAARYAALPGHVHRAIRAAGASVVLSEGPVAVDLAACLAARKERVPCLVRRHVVLADTHHRPWKKSLFRVLDAQVRKKASGMIYLFEEQARRDNCADAIIVRNGVDTLRFRPLEHAPKILDRNNPRIGMVAQFVEAKNWPFFLQIAEILASKIPGLEIVCVGDGPLRPAIKRGVAQGPLSGRVTFTGQIEDPVAVLQSLDLFVLTSRREGLSMSCLEAMACGVPVLTTPTSGSELLVATGGAAIIQHDEPTSAAWLAAGILSDEKRHTAMARSARQGVVSQFALPVGAAALLSALTRASGSHSSAR